jgi:hypothetical protein
MSHRNRYLALVVPCLLNCAAMFFVAFGAAFGGPQRVLLWPAVALFIGGVLILAAISAIRAAQVGHSPVLAFVAVALASSFGPAVLLPIAYLAFKPEAKSGPRPSSTAGAWLQSLALLAPPWVILVFFGLGRSL